MDPVVAADRREEAPAPPRRIGAGDVTVAASATIALAAVYARYTYRSGAVALVLVATVAALGALVLSRGGHGPGVLSPGADQGSSAMSLRAGFAAFFTVSAGAAILVPGGLYGAGAPLVASHVLALLAAVTALVLVVRPAPSSAGRRHLTLLVAGTGVAASLCMIQASPRPRIDVWAMYQAAAHALLHGHSPYLAHWTSGLVGEVSNQFTYLPGSAVLLTPWYLLFGDVRYGLVAAMAVTAFLAYRLGGRSGAFAACAVLAYPGGISATEQSWNDPLLMASLVGAVYAVRRGRTGWAVAAVATALTCKQYAFLLVPLAALWRPFGWRRTAYAVAGAAAFVAPWFLAAPHAFVSGVVSYNLDLPPRPDSLSLYALGLHHGVVPGMGFVAVCTVAAVALAAVRVRRRPDLILAGAGCVIAVFDLVNKQSFFNEWELAAVLLVVGPTAWSGPEARSPAAE